MKVLIVNTSEHTGGAAVAANRLMKALINNGVKAKMLVRDKETDSLTVIGMNHHIAAEWYFLYERLQIWICNLFHRKNLFKVSTASTGFDITRLPEFQEADIIHLHWINQGFLSLSSIEKILKSRKPVVWTMHDMWEATSICHHAYECTNYKSECHHCPFLSSPGKHDLSNKVFHKKQRLTAYPIHYVAVSNWLAERAKQSALIGKQPIHVIPNSISPSQFSMINRTDARAMLSVKEKYVVAFGAARIDDDIKGLSYLLDALRILISERGYKSNDIRLLLFGGIKDESKLNEIPVEYTYFGYVNDHSRMSQIYSAANVVVSSSLYETFGQTLIEAQLCGCIPVAFNNSGQSDIIHHKEDGYLADYLSANSLADGLEWAFNAKIEPRDQKKGVVRRYAESVVAAQYIHLYQDISKKNI